MLVNTLRFKVRWLVRVLCSGVLFFLYQTRLFNKRISDRLVVKFSVKLFCFFFRLHCFQLGRFYQMVFTVGVTRKVLICDIATVCDTLRICGVQD